MPSLRRRALISRRPRASERKRVAVARTDGQNELVVTVLNAAQRVMITGAATFTAVKKRRLLVTAAPPVCPA